MARLSSAESVLSKLNGIYQQIDELYEVVEIFKQLNKKYHDSHEKIQQYEQRLEKQIRKNEDLEKRHQENIEMLDDVNQRSQMELQGIVNEFEQEKARVTEALKPLKVEKRDIETLRQAINDEIITITEKVAIQTENLSRRVEQARVDFQEELTGSLHDARYRIAEQIHDLLYYKELVGDKLSRFNEDMVDFRENLEIEVNRKIEMLLGQYMEWKNAITVTVTRRFADEKESIEFLKNRIELEKDALIKQFESEREKVYETVRLAEDRFQNVEQFKESAQKEIELLKTSALAQVQQSIEAVKNEQSTAIEDLHRQIDDSVDAAGRKLRNEIKDEQRQLSDQISSTDQEHRMHLEQNIQAFNHRIGNEINQLEDFKTAMETRIEQLTRDLTLFKDDAENTLNGQMASLRQALTTDSQALEAKMTSGFDEKSALLDSLSQNVSQSLVNVNDELRSCTHTRDQAGQLIKEIEDNLKSFKAKTDIRLNETIDDLIKHQFLAEQSLKQEISKTVHDASTRIDAFKADADKKMNDISDRFEAENRKVQDAVQDLLDRKEENEALQENLKQQFFELEASISGKNDALDEKFRRQAMEIEKSIQEKRRSLSQQLDDEIVRLQKAAKEQADGLTGHVNDLVALSQQSLDEAKNDAEKQLNELIAFKQSIDENIRSFETELETIKKGVFQQLNDEAAKLSQQQEQFEKKADGHLDSQLRNMSEHLKVLEQSVRDTADELNHAFESEKNTIYEMVDEYTKTFSSEYDTLIEKSKAVVDENDRRIREKLDQLNAFQSTSEKEISDLKEALEAYKQQIGQDLNETSSELIRRHSKMQKDYSSQVEQMQSLISEKLKALTDLHSETERSFAKLKEDLASYKQDTIEDITGKAEDLINRHLTLQDHLNQQMDGFRSETQSRVEALSALQAESEKQNGDIRQQWDICRTQLNKDMTEKTQALMDRHSALQDELNLRFGDLMKTASEHLESIQNDARQRVEAQDAWLETSEERITRALNHLSEDRENSAAIIEEIGLRVSQYDEEISNRLADMTATVHSTVHSCEQISDRNREKVAEYIDSLSSLKADLARQWDEKLNEFKRLEENVRNITSEQIQIIKSRHATLEQETDTRLQNGIDKLTAQSEELQNQVSQRLTEHDAAHRDNQAVIDNAVQQIRSEQQALLDMKEAVQVEAGKQSELIIQIESRWEKIKEDARTHADELNTRIEQQIRGKLDQLENHRKNQEKNASDVLEQLQTEITEKIKQVEQTRQTSENRMEKISASLETEQERISSALNGIREDLSADLASHSDKMEILKTDCRQVVQDAAAQHLSTLENRLLDFRKEIDTYKDRLYFYIGKEMEKTNKKQDQAQRESFEKIASDLEKQSAAMISWKDATDSDIQKTIQRFDHEIIPRLESDRQTLEQLSTSIENRMDTLDKVFVQKSSDIDTTLKRINDENAALQTRHRDAEDRLSAMENRVISTEKEVSDRVEQWVSDNESRIDTLEKDIGNRIQEKLDEWTQLVDTSKKTVDEIREDADRQIQATESQIYDSLNRKIDQAIEGRINFQDEAMKRIILKLKETNKTLQDKSLKSLDARVKEHFSRHSGTLEQLTGKITKIDSQIADIHSENKKIRAGVRDTDVKFADYIRKLAQKQNDYQASFSELEKRLEKLEKRR